MQQSPSGTSDEQDPADPAPQGAAGILDSTQGGIHGVADADEIQHAARRLTGSDPLAVLRWAAGRFAPRLSFATAFGLEGCVLIDLIGRHRLPIDVFTLDTGLLFPETRALWARLEERYDLRIRAVRPELSLAVQAARYGEALWEREPDRCCALRKVAPLHAALAGREAWIASIRRDQTAARAAAAVVEHDRTFGLVKVSPLLGWSLAEVWAHLRAHGVPTNPLHAQGYPSVGCWPCTSAVAAGEDARAGRWRGHAKTECGLHLRPSTEIPNPQLTPRQDAVSRTEKRLVPIGGTC